MTSVAWLETKLAADVVIPDCKFGRGRGAAVIAAVLAVVVEVEVESLQLTEEEEAVQLCVWGKLTWFAMTTLVRLELEEKGELWLRAVVVGGAPVDEVEKLEAERDGEGEFEAMGGVAMDGWELVRLLAAEVAWLCVEATTGVKALL